MSGSLDRESVAEYQVLVVAMDLAGNVGNIQQVRGALYCMEGIIYGSMSQVNPCNL